MSTGNVSPKLPKVVVEDVGELDDELLIMLWEARKPGESPKDVLQRLIKEEHDRVFKAS